MAFLAQLKKLSEFFDKSLLVANLEDDIPDPEETGEEAEEAVRWFFQLTIIEKATGTPECMNLLREINSEIYQNVMASPTKRDNWEFLCEHVAKDEFLAFVYALLNVAIFDLANETYRKLSFLTGQCYLLALTLPGARTCGIFDERVLRKVVKLCESVETVRDMKLDRYQLVEFQVNFINLLEYFKTFLKYIALDECALLKDTILVTFKNIILYYMKNGYKSIYDYDFTKMSYQILASMCNPSHGDVTDTIKLLFSIMSVLHNYNIPQSKERIQKDGVHGENVMDFFIHLLDLFPTNTTAVLTNFIKAFITNPDETLKPEQHSQMLDVCVRYDAVMFSKCNQSIVDFLIQATLSAESQHRVNSVDLLGRILLVDSRVNWSLFTDEVSKIPREISILRVLFRTVIDTHNTVKLRAIGGIQKAFQSGNKMTKQILNTLFEVGTVRQEDAADTSATDIEGVEELAQEEAFQQLPSYMYHLMKNTTAHVRKAALGLLEVLCKYDKKIVQRKRFAVEVCELADDQNAIVKKQLIQMVNNLLFYYPDNDVLIECWTKSVLKLMKDSDTKIVEATMESLKRIIFDNIERLENSNSNIAYLPWTILKKMLQQEFRGTLRSVVDSCINNNLLSQKTLSIIESHTTTKYSTEAWLLLSLVANKMHSSNPDTVAMSFIMQVNGRMVQNTSGLINLQLMLEVIFAWMPDISRVTINKLYETIYDLLLAGTVSSSSLVNPLYEVCKALKKTENPKGEDNLTWIEALNRSSLSYIADKRDLFYKNEALERQLVINFYIYSETCTDLPHPADPSIKSFCVTYLRNVSSGVISDDVDNKKVAQKLCVLVIVITRLAIRDNDLANDIVPVYGQLLAKTKHKNVANNLIICLTDMCKKHTTMTEPIMQEVICKLRGEYNVIRYKALSCLSILVLQDYLKMRGRLLMNLLATIVDPCHIIRENAALMILKYVEEKNRLLLQTSLFETIFAFNGYLDIPGFDLFDEMRGRLSPMQGSDKKSLRKIIYKFFVQNIGEEQLLNFFSNLLTINEKLKKDTLIRNGEAVPAIHDFIYVLKIICRNKSWSRIKSSGGDPQDEDNVNAELTQMQKEQQQQQPSTSSRAAKKKSAVMNRGITLLEQSIAVMPSFYKTVERFDKSLTTIMDRFLRELCRNFGTFVQFVQPAQFWNRYRTKGKKKTKKQKAAEMSSESENDSDGEGTITTMDSCPQHNFSDEDFDDI